MKSPLRLLGFLFVLLTITGGAVWAATQNALVTGSVFDQNGAAVPGATVRLLNASIGFSQTLPTDANGNYTFGSVPPAENYVMSVEISGFATVIRPGLSVAVGEAKLVLPPFILQPAAQPGQEIREEAPAAAPVALEMVSTTLGGVVDSRALRTLPLVGRDFIDLALLIPGTYPVQQGSALDFTLSDGTPATYVDGSWRPSGGNIVWGEGGAQTMVFDRDGLRTIIFHNDGPRMDPSYLWAIAEGMVVTP